MLFKQNTYFGSRSQTRWWNGVSLILNSSDKFNNSAIFFNENVDKNEYTNSVSKKDSRFAVTYRKFVKTSDEFNINVCIH